MDFRDYAAFLPAAFLPAAFLPAAGLVPPASTWWSWRGRQIHVARRADPDAPARVMVIHGGGGYSGALWPAAAGAAGDDVELLAPDLPLYGDTVEPDPAGVRYQDWVDLLCDLVAAESAADPRPIILFGASMGGMLAYEAAARTGAVAAVVTTCLLDTTDPQARAAATRYGWMGGPAPRLLRTAAPVLGRVRLPIRWLADMANMSSNPGLSRLCAFDPRGGGVRVPLQFLSSWLNFAHTAPESYAGAPVTLVAPAADQWTPPHLSLGFLQRISGETTAVMLENCGHFPIEEPGLTQLRTQMRRIVMAAGPAR